MRYDRELQAAGKFFVATIQGGDGKRGRELMDWLKDPAAGLDTRQLTLDVFSTGGKLVAIVGKSWWPPASEYREHEVVERIELE